jgi:hypothetical protein
MIDFIQELKTKNETLFYFGVVCFVASIGFLILAKTTSVQVYNVSAWYKPFKFAFSTVLFSFLMAWFCSYLSNFNTIFFSWSIVLLLGFEIVYIAIQAGKGQLSHYNMSSPSYAILYSMMAIAATLVTIYTLYVAFLFFTQKFPELESHYLWAIRLSLLLFVVFSFEGFVMGSKLTHTIGGPDGEAGIPILNWSTKYGDPRIPHFIGMHALQVIPLLSYYVLKSTRLTIVVSVLYALLAIYTLVIALKGKSLFSQYKKQQNERIK